MPERGARRLTLGIAMSVAVFALITLATTVVRAPHRAPSPMWTDPHTGMEFALIPSGTFRMGTSADEPGREAGEVPHLVTLSRAFYLGQHEVTQAQWQLVMGTSPWSFRDCGPQCPVERVNWLDIQEFIRRLNAASRPGFRLPTEAEWEYGCRAGGDQVFGHAASLSSRDANINGNYPYDAPTGTFRERPTPRRILSSQSLGVGQCLGMGAGSALRVSRDGRGASPGGVLVGASRDPWRQLAVRWPQCALRSALYAPAAGFRLQSGRATRP